jgi:hypothetical protein
MSLACCAAFVSRLHSYAKRLRGHPRSLFCFFGFLIFAFFDFIPLSTD